MKKKYCTGRKKSNGSRDAIPCRGITINYESSLFTLGIDTQTSQETAEIKRACREATDISQTLSSIINLVLALDETDRTPRQVRPQFNTESECDSIYIGAYMEMLVEPNYSERDLRKMRGVKIVSREEMRKNSTKYRK